MSFYHDVTRTYIPEHTITKTSGKFHNLKFEHEATWNFVTINLWKKQSNFFTSPFYFCKQRSSEYRHNFTIVIWITYTWYSRSQGSESCNPTAIFSSCRLCMQVARGCRFIPQTNNKISLTSVGSLYSRIIIYLVSRGDGSISTLNTTKPTHMILRCVHDS